MAQNGLLNRHTQSTTRLATMSDIEIRWQHGDFAQLSGREVFDMLRLRQSVFIVEQNCPYPDIDDADIKGSHLLAWQEGELIACSRLLGPGITYPNPSIGRVATAASHRGGGLGRRLMERSIVLISQAYPDQAIKIGAQHYLEKFYMSLGFQTQSEVYLEDGIPHIDMLRPANTQ